MRTPALGRLGALVSLVSLLAVVPHALAAPSITEFPLPTATAAPWDITAGADGNVWFTERIAAQVGRITPEGVITEFPLPPGDTFEFIPVKSSVATGSGAPGSCGGRSRVPSRDHGRQPSTGGCGL
jgi:streptogramin lyase